MLTSKQRAYLRKQANPITAIMQIGKQGAAKELCAAIEEALEARELIKVSVLNNCETPARELAEEIVRQTRAECVQVIGKKIVLYRRSAANPVIELP